MKVVKDKEFITFDKAPGKQWIIVLTDGRKIYSFILNNRLYPDVITMGEKLTPSAKAFESEKAAWDFIRLEKLDRNLKVAVVDFVEEMKHLMRLKRFDKMVNEPYVRITCENNLGEKFYINHDSRTNQLFPDKDWRNTFMQTQSKAEAVIKEISKEKTDKYKNYKTEEL